MQDVQPNLFTRDDTFLGVCEGLGQDLGINPLFLRLPFIPALFFYPLATIGVYLAAGLVVLTTRIALPNPRAAKPEIDTVAAEEEPAVREEAESEPVAIAA